MRKRESDSENEENWSNFSDEESVPENDHLAQGQVNNPEAGGLNFI